MAVTNFDVSALTAYVKQSEEVILREVLRGGDFIPKMRMQLGVKTTELIHPLEVNAVFDDGSACGYNPLSEVNITERAIVTAAIKAELEICSKTLLATFAEYQVRLTAGAENRPFEQYIVDGIIASVNKQLNKAIFQGDTTSADLTLKWFDGLLTIAGADSDVIPVSITSGSTAYAGLQAVAAALPDEAIEAGAYINVAPSIFYTYMQNLVAANLYHYNPGDGEFSEFALPGTNIRVRKAAGLAGSLQVLATYDNNLYFGTDLEGSREDVYADYDFKNETFWMRILFNAGVNYAWSDQVVLGTFASTPI